jgi:hypothetical protein
MLIMETQVSKLTARLDWNGCVHGTSHRYHIGHLVHKTKRLLNGKYRCDYGWMGSH